MKKYKLKEDAVPFFDQRLAMKVENIEFWDKNHVSINALDEVGNVYITYGIKINEISASLAGYDGNLKEGKLHFTLNISDLTSNEYESLTSQNGELRNLMSEIQHCVNMFIDTLDDVKTSET